jgi:hypothetical protein
MGSQLLVTGTFTDPGIAGDAYTITSKWTSATSPVITIAGTKTAYNGTTGAFSISAPAGTAPGSIPAGVYTVKITVTDRFSAASSEWVLGTYMVVFDPTGGFVTGGGWIDSPAGAYRADLTLTGKANFGFVSKYQKGATVPTGDTEFQFKEGNLNFKSTNFQWLVIQGTSMSQFKGTGTINGAGSYNFLVTANDGDASGVKKPDSFRIKITQGTTVVYDNKYGVDETLPDATTLGGGSIQIQSK